VFLLAKKSFECMCASVDLMLKGVELRLELADGCVRRIRGSDREGQAVAVEDIEKGRRDL
jgi:hypothetical protein